MLRALISFGRVSSLIPQRCLHSEAITYSEYGEPEKVLSLTSRPLKTFTNDEVLVKICAAAVHPSDINTIQGVYPIKPPLPAVAGNEGVGRVLACGKNVDSLAVGDMVIPAKVSSGTWQTHICGKPQDFMKINHSLPILHAAVFLVNPGTALRMLTDFVDLQKGDIVMQNGSTSSVGIYAIQLAKLLGFRTVNLFRERSTKEATEEMRETLKSYGATWALTESELLDPSNPSTSELSKSGPIKLALNCLGGKPATLLLRFLGHGGTLVSYGAMTRNPMPVPAGPLIFKDIRLRGFWISGWTKNHEDNQKQLMIDQLAKWFSDRVIKPSPYVEVPLKDWKEAIKMSTFQDSIPSGIRKKVILTMD